MKFRNQFLKYKMHAVGEDGQQGGSNGGSANDGKQSDGSTGGKTNTGDNAGLYANMWDTPSTDDGAKAQMQQQPQAPARSASELFNAHVETLGFGTGAEEMMAAFESRDGKAFAKAMASMQAATYKAAMMDSNRLMKESSSKLQNTFQQDTTKTIENSKLLDRLYSDVPFAARPQYEPLARGVLQQFLTQSVNGKRLSPDEAVKETGKYFEQMARDISGRSPENDDPNSGRGSGSKRGGSNLDFVALFAGENKS